MRNPTGCGAFRQNVCGREGIRGRAAIRCGRNADGFDLRRFVPAEEAAVYGHRRPRHLPRRKALLGLRGWKEETIRFRTRTLAGGKIAV